MRDKNTLRHTGRNSKMTQSSLIGNHFKYKGIELSKQNAETGRMG